MHPQGPRQRQKLFIAALKLLRFAVGIETACCENSEQTALQAALLPLLRLEDGHVLATLSAIVLALCEGRAGLAISGVFGAGKTRSAAALLAGLLVFDPSLQLMVLTKENVAAHAVAEHFVSLRLLDHVQGKMGRLVGYTMSKTGKAPGPPWTSLFLTGTRAFDRSHSLLGAVVGSNPSFLLLNGCAMLTWFLRMKGSSMATWKRQPPWPEHRPLVWRYGLATTGKRAQVVSIVWKQWNLSIQRPSCWHEIGWSCHFDCVTLPSSTWHQP